MSRMLPRCLYLRIAELITPLFDDVARRKAIVNAGVYEDKLIDQIDLSGSAQDFTYNMLKTVIRYDLAILIQLIEFISDRYAGSDQWRELRWIQSAVKFLADNDPDRFPPPPNGGGKKSSVGDLEKLYTMKYHEIYHVIAPYLSEFDDAFLILTSQEQTIIRVMLSLDSNFRTVIDSNKLSRSNVEDSLQSTVFNGFPPQSIYSALLSMGRINPDRLNLEHNWKSVHMDVNEIDSRDIEIAEFSDLYGIRSQLTNKWSINSESYKCLNYLNEKYGQIEN